MAVVARKQHRSRPTSNIAAAAIGAVVTLLVVYSTRLPSLQSSHDLDQSELPLGTNGRLEDSWGRSNQVRGDEVQVSREREVLEVDEEDDEQDNNSVGIDDTAAETYRPPGPMNPRASSPFLDKIATCSSLECLKAAHLLPRGVAKFNHPHVLIIGFQKAATTSLFSYLARHNETLASYLKEPEFFVNGCKSLVPENCSTYATTRYIHRTLRSWIYLDWNGTKGSFEGSTHTVRAGDLLAPRLLNMMPWVKLIVSLREPISRAASMLIHNEDKKNLGCLSRLKSMGKCLLKGSQVRFPTDGGPSDYYTALKPWIDTWPSTQLFVLQYEDFTGEEREEMELMRVKQYVGIDLTRPEGGLEMRNARRFKIQPEGWPIKRSEYQELVDIVRKDMKRTLDLLDTKSLVQDRARWEKLWEDVWKQNLDSCDSNGKCNMLLS